VQNFQVPQQKPTSNGQDMTTNNQRPTTNKPGFTLVEMLACPPKPWRRGSRAAFTLVEMLVVIAILGILMAMMVPAAGLIVRRARVSRTKGDAGIVVTAMLKYNSEYNRWPPDYMPAGTGDTDRNWAEIMSAAVTNRVSNFKHITFFQPGGGALGTATLPNGNPNPHAGAFVDAWGNPFRFVLDVAGTGQLNNPNVDVGGNPIRGRVLAWSAGPDGDHDTWADNVGSWERIHADRAAGGGGDHRAAVCGGDAGVRESGAEGHGAGGVPGDEHAAAGAAACDQQAAVDAGDFPDASRRGGITTRRIWTSACGGMR
jgi:prepilin-type N-terminal cleavage/methylation domain-containing protein